jgi:hypothetical protein
VRRANFVPVRFSQVSGGRDGCFALLRRSYHGGLVGDGGIANGNLDSR